MASRFCENVVEWRGSVHLLPPVFCQMGGQQSFRRSTHDQLGFDVALVALYTPGVGTSNRVHEVFLVVDCFVGIVGQASLKC